MTNRVLIKKSGTATAIPTAGDLLPGELAINYNDGNLFYKNSANVVTVIASNQFVSVVGNVTGNYFIGNGSQLTGITVSAGTSILNGNSNVSVAANGNITVGVAGTSNVVVFADTGEYVTGVVSASGNITGSYVLGNGSQLTGVNANSAVYLRSSSNTAAYAYINDSYDGFVLPGNGGLLYGGSYANSFGSIDVVPSYLDPANAYVSLTFINMANSLANPLNFVEASNTGITLSYDFNNNFTGTKTATFNQLGFSVAGNITSGNIFAGSGVITTSGNVTGGNLLAGTGVITTSGNITGGNLNAAGLSLSSNVVSALNSTSNITTTANVTGGNLNGAGLSLTGNVLSKIDSTSNIATSANISASYFLGNGACLSGIITSVSNINNGTSNVSIAFADANITFGVSGVSNVIVATPTGMTVTGTISTSSNITGGSLNAAGLSLSSNVVSALNSTSNITTSANIAANYFIGNGSQLTGIDATSIQNGNSNVKVYANANVTTSSNGVANVVVVSDTGQYVTGVSSTSGNVTGGNITTAGQLISTQTGSATTGAGQLYLNGATNNRIDFNTNGTAAPAFTTRSAGTKVTLFPAIGGSAVDYALGIEAGALWTSIPGNDAGQFFKWYGGETQVGSLSGTGVLSVAGNITGANLNTAGAVSAASVSASGNVTGGNILAGSGVVTTSGNITGGNLNAAGLSLSSNVVSALNSTSNITTTANVSGSYFLGNGSQLTGIDATSIQNGTSNVRVLSSGGNVTVGIGGTSNVAVFATTGEYVTGEISASGNVTGGNLITSAAISGASVSASGNITGGNIMGGANVNATTHTGTTVSVTGNITGGNIMGGANVNATTHTGTTVSVTGNVTGGNTVVTTAVVVPTVRNTAALTISTSAGDLNLQPTGNVVVNSKYINGVTNPVQDQDVATKIYVDNAVSTAISYHQPVTVATTTTLATTTGGIITYTQPNGAGNGVGALLTTTGSFNLIDTANVQTVDTRILVKNEANAVYNGVYTWANATNIVRSTDTNTYGAGNVSAIGLNDYFFTTGGNVNLGTAFIVSAPTGTITFGTSNIVFSTFSTSQTYTANTSAGVSLAGTVINAKVDGVTTAFDGSGNISVKASANLTTPNIGAATGTSLSVTGNITGGNILGGANVNATTHTGTTVSVSANITGGNVLTGGVVSATGNIIGGNLIVNGSISDAGQLDITTTASNGNIVLTPNGTGNVNTGANVSVTGNITGGNLSGTNIVGTLTTASQTNITSVGTLGSLTVTANITPGNVTTAGQFVSTLTGNVGNGLAQIYLNGATLNRIDFNQNGTNPPAFTTRSSGTKIVLYPNIGAAAADYAFGIDGGVLWSGVPTTSNQFKWYAGTTQVAALGGGGNLSVTGAVTAASVVGGVMTGSSLSVTGNITGGNLIISGAILDSTQLDIQTTSANANIVFTPNGTGNVNTGANVSITGNIQGGNLRTAGLISATGAITGAGITGTSLTVSTGNVTLGNIINANGNAVGNIGSSTVYFNTLFAKATSAQYADLAEMYLSDADYAPGTVLIFGGEQEVTADIVSHSTAIAGVVSEKPSHLMNAGLQGKHVVAVALLGRVPCQVQGTVRKGDLLVASDTPGVSQRLNPDQYRPGCVIGKALANYVSDTVGTIEIAVGVK